VTKHTIDCLKGTVCSASPNHGLTALEIQRWEDDGGAIFTSCVRRRQRCDRHVHDAPRELAPAAKTDVSEMVDRVAAGEEIVIAKAGKPKAKLVPYQPPRKKRRLAQNLLGITYIAEDFDSPLPPAIQECFE
jgi:prevent-host-death family protein